MIMDSWPEHPDLEELKIVIRDSNDRFRFRDMSLSDWTTYDLKIIFPSLSTIVLTSPTTNKREVFTWPKDDSEPPATEAVNTPDSS